MRRAVPVLFLLASLLACRAEEAGRQPARPGEPAMQDHDVPEALAVLAARTVVTRGEDGVSMEFRLDVPTGGFELVPAEGVGGLGEDGTFEAIFDLTAPGNGELVTQAVETLTVGCALPDGAVRCVVRVRPWVRGFSYIVVPEAQFVAARDLPR